MYLLYINGLNSVFNEAITIHYADDTHVSSVNKKLSTIETVLNYELNKSVECLRSSKLSLKSGKSELVIFRPKTKIELDKITMKINKFILCPVQNVNYIDVALDECLSWDAHVHNLCKKPAQTNDNLSQLRHYVPQKTCISVCFSLFYSFIVSRNYLSLTDVAQN